MFAEKVLYIFGLRVQPVFLYQLYHILRVFHNSSLMAMLHGMALERQQMHQ